ncbi:Short-chain dehydrogenase/reductase SDR [Penicillium vulpinum]|uniref:Short-chain dehydrogenase/reductase SDR n=1 Tax=Penicillium vulpinum TaxID=29845 RepID=UPI002546E83F|nr:Short-chain dehydrogenase/reductase SDR [Penicillium vulpinum]KAJ5959557.1 Short-chain dehydrogenase/reductase SDR [Penicillium vulpinum]
MGAASQKIAWPNCHVIPGSRQLNNGEEAVKKLQADTDVKRTVSGIELDVTEDKSVDAAAEKVAVDYGCLDILVNNTGIVSLANPPSQKKYRNVLNTNVVGSLTARPLRGVIGCSNEDEAKVYIVNI